MEIYADDLKYFEPDTENKTNVPESIEKVKNNEKDLKAQYIYQDSKLSTHSIPSGLVYAKIECTVQQATCVMAIWVVEFSREGYKIRKRYTLIWNARYCPSNNTTQAKPYKSRDSGYPQTA